MFVTVSGVRVSTKADGTSFDPGGVTRADVNGATEQGFTEEPRPAMLETNALHKAGVSLRGFLDQRNVTVFCETDTGVNFTMASAWNTGETKLSSGEAGLTWKCDYRNVVEDVP